ncbi:MAG: methyl-accepting chemotaxis protein [Desulfobacterales bacterium]|jgi:methyl-accepting chemotaxis protein
MLKKTKLSTKMILLGIFTMLCFAIVFGWIYPKFKKQLYEANHIRIQHLVDVAADLIDFYIKQVESNKMTSDEAQELAKDAIKNMHYEKKGYFWINDISPKMVMDPLKPEMDGIDLSDHRDTNGKRPFMEMVEMCRKNGSGFVEYHWPKPGDHQPVAKISFVKLVAQWNWIIGSGFYIDDIEEEASRSFYLFLTVLGVISVGGLLLTLFLLRDIFKPIHRVIEGLNEAAVQLSSASQEISATSHQLAEGASEQASSVEESSSSLEQMASMTRHNAESAEQADNLMKETNQTVEQAKDSMMELSASMDQISDASEATSNIIKTIDEIAFQTNLLALNAAVEAARAGEAGAGFAVVADEVRSLAMRSADAAQYIAEMIEGTISEVSQGVELVKKANEAFSEVAARASKVTELVEEIAAASKEQAQGINQINSAVADMDKVIQQNAANAEESASASEEMNAQAKELKAMVSQLVELVGHKVNSAEKDASHTAIETERGSVAPVEIFNSNFKTMDQANEIRPEQIIPLDEKDFKDF